MDGKTVALVTPNVSGGIIEKISYLGVSVISEYSSSVTLGICSPENLYEEKYRDWFIKLRRARVPIVDEKWVKNAIQRPIPPFIASLPKLFNPFIFSSLHFTTTGVRNHIKDNLIAVVQFFGGIYEPCLTQRTIFLVCETHQSSSEKKIVAMRSNIHIVTLMWVQRSINERQLLPWPSS